MKRTPGYVGGEYLHIREGVMPIKKAQNILRLF